MAGVAGFGQCCGASTIDLGGCIDSKIAVARLTDYLEGKNAIINTMAFLILKTAQRTAFEKEVLKMGFVALHEPVFNERYKDLDEEARKNHWLVTYLVNTNEWRARNTKPVESSFSHTSPPVATPPAPQPQVVANPRPAPIPSIQERLNRFDQRLVDGDYLDEYNRLVTEMNARPRTGIPALGKTNPFGQIKARNHRKDTW